MDQKRIPRHIAIIMDGNGRWAKERGLERVQGHIQGVESVRKVVRAAASYGVEYLTIYAFSTENWGRPSREVEALRLRRYWRKEYGCVFWEILMPYLSK